MPHDRSTSDDIRMLNLVFLDCVQRAARDNPDAAAHRFGLPKEVCQAVADADPEQLCRWGSVPILIFQARANLARLTDASLQQDEAGIARMIALLK